MERFWGLRFYVGMEFGRGAYSCCLEARLNVLSLTYYEGFLLLHGALHFTIAHFLVVYLGHETDCGIFSDSACALNIFGCHWRADTHFSALRVGNGARLRPRLDITLMQCVSLHAAYLFAVFFMSFVNVRVPSWLNLLRRCRNSSSSGIMLNILSVILVLLILLE